MVEKRIEFYFSKHPHTELDCGWSRKGSSNLERSLIMANAKFNRQEKPVTTTRIVCSYKPDLCSTPLRVERALTRGLVYVTVHFEYLDHSDPSFSEDDWVSGVISFEEFETLVNYMLYEFNCVQLKDTKPLRSKQCWHTVDAVFTRQEGTI